MDKLHPSAFISAQLTAADMFASRLDRRRYWTSVIGEPDGAYLRSTEGRNGKN
jgi:hypothetical protein